VGSQRIEVISGVTSKGFEIAGQARVGLMACQEFDEICLGQELWARSSHWADLGDRRPVDRDRDPSSTSHLP
jgi:hypothetical protein